MRLYFPLQRVNLSTLFLDCLLIFFDLHWMLIILIYNLNSNSESKIKRKEHRLQSCLPFWSLSSTNSRFLVTLIWWLKLASDFFSFPSLASRSFFNFSFTTVNFSNFSSISLLKLCIQKSELHQIQLKTF